MASCKYFIPILYFYYGKPIHAFSICWRFDVCLNVFLFPFFMVSTSFEQNPFDQQIICQHNLVFLVVSSLVVQYFIHVLYFSDRTNNLNVLSFYWWNNIYLKVFLSPFFFGCTFFDQKPFDQQIISTHFSIFSS